jgi:hypothetical protein
MFIPRGIDGSNCRYRSAVGRWFTDPVKLEYLETDVQTGLAVDTLDFAMPFSREGDLLIMRKAT